MIKVLNWIAENFFGTVIFLVIVSACVRYALGYDPSPLLVIK